MRMASGLFHKLDEDAVLIAAHARQAEQFRLAHAHWKKQQGIKAWPSPAIYSWNEWLKRMGENLLWSGYSGKQGVRSLLTPLQEQTVWEQVIRADINNPLLHLSSTAASARQAWAMIQAWRMPDPKAAQFPSEDVKAFNRWVANYYKRCKNAAWLDQARLPDTLKRAIKLGNVALPNELIFAGFIQFTPQQIELITAIREKNTQINLYKPTEVNASVNGKKFDSTQQEFQSIAKWCREKLEKNADARIAVAVPGLSGLRSKLDKVLRKSLYPSSFHSEQEFINPAYQFSTGESLADSSIAQMAMSLLELIQGNFTLDHISSILRNPYCYGGKAEQNERMKMDAWLRRQGLLEFNLSTLLDIFKAYHRKNNSNDTTLFEVSLMTLKTSAGITKSYYSPSIWAKHFLSYLEKFGWPDINLNSYEQRHAHAMRSCLTEFASIDFVQNEMDFKSALGGLRRLMLSKRLGISQIFAPIQILDLEEIFALNYDHVWVAQLSDSVFPENTIANPMIPYAWQRKRKINGTTPKIRLHEAEQRLQHLKCSAKEVIFSFATDGINAQENPPAMLRELSFEPVSDKSDFIPDVDSIEWIEEHQGSVYQGSSEVSTSVFKHQSECPFKAFAKARLLPERLERSEYGLTALERGQILHNTLEYLWLRIGTLDTLHIALQSEHLEMQIWEIVDKVIAVHEKKLPYKLSQRLKAIEQNRLVRLTLAWLQVEKERAPFEMQRSEHSTEVDINGLKVQCRIDRIDEVNDVGFVIIDYKSGVSNSSAWFGERPDQPQMPIYALAEQNRLVAILYANIKTGALGFNGLSEASDIIPGLKAFNELGEHQRRGLSWSDLIPYWRSNLDKLSEEFQQGLAIPDPKKGKQTCRLCKLESLCRINASNNVKQQAEMSPNV